MSKQLAPGRGQRDEVTLGRCALLTEDDRVEVILVKYLLRLVELVVEHLILVVLGDKFPGGGLLAFQAGLLGMVLAENELFRPPETPGASAGPRGAPVDRPLIAQIGQEYQAGDDGQHPYDDGQDAQGSGRRPRRGDTNPVAERYGAGGAGSCACPGHGPQGRT